MEDCRVLVLVVDCCCKIYFYSTVIEIDQYQSQYNLDISPPTKSTICPYRIRYLRQPWLARMTIAPYGVPQ